MSDVRSKIKIFSQVSENPHTCRLTPDLYGTGFARLGSWQRRLVNNQDIIVME
ncbi:hypothetical protein OAF63_06150 [Saprospiraceae bacterium]|nr:hypothetical protein [Saprospiraceae bacterium]